jgi:hypothetical protein
VSYLSAKWYVQVALYNALKGDTTFMNLIGSRLYDEPTTNTPYPYVQIGTATENLDNTHDKKGYNITFTNYIYTKPAGLGYYQADIILRAMNDVLHMKTFTTTSYNMIICKLDNAFWSRDEDKRIIDARYRIFVQAT